MERTRRQARGSLALEALSAALQGAALGPQERSARGAHPETWNARVADMTPSQAPAGAEHGRARTERFHALYRDHFDFVFRNLRRLGIPPASVDDALQDVFVVVLRRLDGFREGTHPKAWLFAIALRVAGNYRRAQSRRAPTASLAPDALAGSVLGPFDQLSRSEAARVLHDFLDSLDDDKRAVFVLAELEQMTAPEIAQALAVNVNTVYSRLRAARIAFEQTVLRLRASSEEHG
ncbi:MAG TPA: sigma-70 family RNA polymerase sigma factor [Polyangiales bacterium]|nr:sigma-70 family RNA polymerase sigma factor [Polyangiales bacterium]